MLCKELKDIETEEFLSDSSRVLSLSENVKLELLLKEPTFGFMSKNDKRLSPPEISSESTVFTNLIFLDTCRPLSIHASKFSARCFSNFQFFVIFR